MTDTPETEENATPGEGAEGAVATATEPEQPTDTTAPAEDESGADAAPPAKTPFWERPNVERYLVPFVLPLLVVSGVVMLILNISRIFLSTHGNVDVIVGTAITLTILIGASILSASPRMRSSSLALIAAGFVLVLMMGGWLALGSAEEEGEAEATLPAEGPAAQELGFVANNNLLFTPDSAEAQTGIARITLENAGGEHTFHFEDAETLLETLGVNATGDTAEGRAFFAEEGDYVFYCTIPGHREAGMEGVVAAAGDTVTLEAAEAAAEEAPAEGGGEAPPESGGEEAPSEEAPGEEAPGEEAPAEDG